MTELDRYLVLKKKVDRIRKEADKAAGALEQTMSRLKKEFKCSTIKEAQKLLDKLEKEENDLLEQLGKALDEFEEKWGATIEEGS